MVPALEPVEPVPVEPVVTPVVEADPVVPPAAVPVFAPVRFVPLVPALPVPVLPLMPPAIPVASLPLAPVPPLPSDFLPVTCFVDADVFALGAAWCLRRVECLTRLAVDDALVPCLATAPWPSALELAPTHSPAATPRIAHFLSPNRMTYLP